MNYHVLPITLLLVGSYLFTYYLFKKGILRRQTHKRIWNLLLVRVTWEQELQEFSNPNNKYGDFNNLQSELKLLACRTIYFNGYWNFDSYLYLQKTSKKMLKALFSFKSDHEIQTTSSDT